MINGGLVIVCSGFVVPLTSDFSLSIRMRAYYRVRKINEVSRHVCWCKYVYEYFNFFLDTLVRPSIRFLEVTLKCAIEALNLVNMRKLSETLFSHK